MTVDRVSEDRRKLLEAGWIRRFTAEEPRLSEMKAVYESMGLEVLLGEAVPEDDQECRGCFDQPGFSDHYKTIYTRGDASGSSNSSEYLFD
jgi:hypothetical protein